MADDIIQLGADDFEEAMDFLNLVFSQHGPHDFAKMLPSIYRPTDEYMAYNYAIRSGGRLRAIVGLFPLEFRLGTAVLKVGGIGGVSTHSNARGQGLMQRLMAHCVAVMQERGDQLSVLGGQRQRYGYFGYECCGSRRRFSLSKANLRHCFADESQLRFEPLAPSDAQWLVRAKALHDAQPLYHVRPLEDFHRFGLSWFSKPSVALDEAGEMVGYIISSGDSVSELVGQDEETAFAMARAWVEQHRGASVGFDISPLAVGLVHRLGQVAEGNSLGTSANWQVFDWVGVADALIKLRRLQGPLLDGAVVVGIEAWGNLRLAVEAGQGSCSRTDQAADLVVDRLTGQRLLFGPDKPSAVVSLPGPAALLDLWCPLPLRYSRPDGV